MKNRIDSEIEVLDATNNTKDIVENHELTEKTSDDKDFKYKIV